MSLPASSRRLRNRKIQDLDPRPDVSSVITAIEQYFDSFKDAPPQTVAELPPFPHLDLLDDETKKFVTTRLADLHQICLRLQETEKIHASTLEQLEDSQMALALVKAIGSANLLPYSIHNYHPVAFIIHNNFSASVQTKEHIGFLLRAVGRSEVQVSL